MEVIDPGSRSPRGRTMTTANHHMGVRHIWRDPMAVNRLGTDDWSAHRGLPLLPLTGPLALRGRGNLAPVGAARPGPGFRVGLQSPGVVCGGKAGDDFR